MIESGWVDPVRLDRRPLTEIMNDHIPFGCKRWKREMREHSIRLTAKGFA